VHWDSGVRELAARSLAALTATDPGYVAEAVLPRLAAGCLSEDLLVRHGRCGVCCCCCQCYYCSYYCCCCD
jgi:hypothetical protein